MFGRSNKAENFWLYGDVVLEALALTWTLTVPPDGNAVPSRGRYWLKKVFWKTWNHIICTFRHMFHNLWCCKAEGRGSLVGRSERSGAQDNALFTVQPDGRFLNCSRTVSPCVDIPKCARKRCRWMSLFLFRSLNPMNMVTLTART